MPVQILPVISTLEIVREPRHSLFHLLPNPSDCVISSVSKWSDTVWRLDGRGATALNWAFLLKDGVKFTSIEHASLLNYFKRFFWSLLVDSRNCPSWTPHSSAVRFTGVKRIASWMVARSHYDFSSLDPEALEEFAEDLLEDLAHEGVQADDTELNYAGSSDIAIDEVVEDVENTDPQGFYTALSAAFDVWKRLWLQAQVMNEAGVPAIQTDPLKGVTPHRAALDLTYRVITRIPPLPDEVALPIMNEAHRWIGIRAADVIRLHNLYLTVLEKNKNLNKINTISDKDAATLAEFQFSVEPGCNEPWHHTVAPVAVTWGKDEMPAYQIPTETVRKLVDTVRAACAIIIQSETGMRVSEVSLIPAGYDVSRGEHNALIIRLSKSGLNELFFIQSTLVKTVKLAKTEEWLAGSRPVGSKFTPGPYRAVHILEELLAGWRNKSTDQRVRRSLFVHIKKGGNALSLKANNYAATRTYGLRNHQQSFVAEYVDLSTLPDKSGLGEDLTFYRESQGRCLTTHQWRKTFAMYVVRTDPRMISAIALQFKHLSIAMTESAYISKDPALMQERDTQQSRAAAAFMYKAVTGKSAVAGRMAKMIDAWAGEILLMVEKKNAVDALNQLEKFCQERRIKVFSSPHGKCFIGLSPNEARCHQLAGTNHWNRQLPNFSTREPDVCNGCKCFGVDSDHSDFWIQRYVEYQSAWQSAVRHGLTAGFRMVQERALQSANMLKALEIPLPHITEDNHA
jgi:integrase